MNTRPSRQPSISLRLLALLRGTFDLCAIGGTWYTASVLFFGSARAKDREGWEKQVAKAEAEMAEANDDESREVNVIGYLFMMVSLSLDTRIITELCI